jgi:hypothetical protein
LASNDSEALVGIFSRAQAARQAWQARLL